MYEPIQAAIGNGQNENKRWSTGKKTQVLFGCIFLVASIRADGAKLLPIILK